MRGLGDFQRRQMTRGDLRVREMFSRLRQLIDLLEDIANHPHQLADITQPAAPPTSPPIPVPKIVVTQQPVPLLVSVKEARRLIGVGNTRIYALINDGSLETVRIGKRRMIRYSSLQRIAGATVR
jgi:excisionase family DNA binding protein